ncbi:LRR receptor-like serine/threonine-protein kinase ERECTA [Zea mays]|uniref:non-specific serine/threonine protein kinase n=1 Tax=Zea mays TaxID=4577 RepID=A0A1D6HLY3_MAIZE|nr:LRR receptor-like serine/threonine-protein kinase ERECTA [Zea mays]
MARLLRALAALLVLLLAAASVAVADDGETLLEIKKSFRDGGNALYDWSGDGASPGYCSWRGVLCDNVTFAVAALNLSGLNLEGEISAAIGSLQRLVSIDLKSNGLSGQIPDEIGDCSLLETLDLSSNNLEGDIPFSMSKLKHLENLILKNNKLVGVIPSTLSQLPNLKILAFLTFHCFRDLSNNHLTGEIPFNIGFLQVATLSLQGNKFSGPIPSVIGLMQALAVLDLSFNELSGPIPSILGNLTYTEKLELNDNLLTGFIPPDLGKLTELFELNLANNNLIGPIPENLSSCANLISLNLSSNHLSGALPIEVARMRNLDTLDLSCNMITGSIPSAIGKLEHLLRLNLSKNNVAGHIPAEFGNLRSIMEIDLSYNHLSGLIPQEVGMLQNLILFFLGNPGLCGYWLHSASCTQLSNAEQMKRSSSAKASMFAAIGVGAVLLVIMLVILVVICWPHNSPVLKDVSVNKPDNLASASNNIHPKLVILHMNMALYVYDDIMRMTENLSEKYIIGYGASSTVYRCDLKNCKPIAIKKLYAHYPQSLKEFETELETVGSIKHRNLVSLQGYSLSPSGNLLFYDYMENGSLWDILHASSKKKKLDWEARLKIALGAAQGLAYLHHECSPRIIHRDVKSKNILLDKDYEAHLADFGIAKSLCVSKTHTSTYVMGTIGYIDPEYARTSRINEKSDVYSYGIVLLELLTGKKPVDDECNLHHLILSKAAENTVMETVDQDITDTCKDLGEVKKVFQLALLCSKRQPSDRPTMHEVARVLDSLVCPAGPPPKQAQAQAQAQASEKPSTTAPSYVSEYVGLRGGGGGSALSCTNSSSASDAELFMKFGEVISRSTE